MSVRISLRGMLRLIRIDTFVYVGWFPRCNKDLKVRLGTKLVVAYNIEVMGF